MNNKNIKIKLKNILLTLTTMLTTTAIMPLAACSGNKDKTACKDEAVSKDDTVCNDKDSKNSKALNQDDLDAIFNEAGINYFNFNNDQSSYKLELNKVNETAAAIFLNSNASDTTSKAKSTQAADFIEFCLGVKVITGKDEDREFDVNELSKLKLTSNQPTITTDTTNFFVTEKFQLQFSSDNWSSMTFTAKIESTKLASLQNQIMDAVKTEWINTQPDFNQIKGKNISEITVADIVTSSSKLPQLVNLLKLEFVTKDEKYKVTREGNEKAKTDTIASGDTLKIDKYRIGKFILDMKTVNIV